MTPDLQHFEPAPLTAWQTLVYAVIVLGPGVALGCFVGAVIFLVDGWVRRLAQRQRPDSEAK